MTESENVEVLAERNIYKSLLSTANRILCDYYHNGKISPNEVNLFLGNCSAETISSRRKLTIERMEYSNKKLDKELEGLND